VYWGSVTPGNAFDDSIQARPVSPQTDTERSRIPLYLGAEHYGHLPAILDYEDWHTLARSAIRGQYSYEVEVEVRQDVPLRIPFHRIFYADDAVRLKGKATTESHYPVFLQ
jgi:hypothetical protein